MKRIYLIASLMLASTTFAQQVQFDYDQSANFATYKTWQWVDRRPVDLGDQLLDQNIKRAVGAQLAGKGLRRVDSGGDLQVSYLGAISKDLQFDSFGWGPGFWGDRRITTSVIKTGTLAIELFDPAAGHLVWRGTASETLDIKKDPDKNYRNLEKAMARLFRNYPPNSGRR